MLFDFAHIFFTVIKFSYFYSPDKLFPIINGVTRAGFCESDATAGSKNLFEIFNCLAFFT